jgi:hypothetical protein
MAVHLDVLDAARRVADGSIFRLGAVVDALPHLNPGTIRTHVASRCCVNAPKHHEVRYPYFMALGGGRYRIQPKDRATPSRETLIPSQDRLIEALGSGADLTLIDRSLRMTPTERIETMRRAAQSLATMLPTMRR